MAETAAWLRKQLGGDSSVEQLGGDSSLCKTFPRHIAAIAPPPFMSLLPSTLPSFHAVSAPPVSLSLTSFHDPSAFPRLLLPLPVLLPFPCHICIPTSLRYFPFQILKSFPYSFALLSCLHPFPPFSSFLYPLLCFSFLSRLLPNSRFSSQITQKVPIFKLNRQEKMKIGRFRFFLNKTHFCK